MLENAAAPPHLGAPHELASLEQNLVGRGTVEADGAVHDRATCGGFRRERGRDTQPAQSILQGEAEPVVGGKNATIVPEHRRGQRHAVGELAIVQDGPTAGWAPDNVDAQRRATVEVDDVVRLEVAQ